jgi:hypothetical protein
MPITIEVPEKDFAMDIPDDVLWDYRGYEMLLADALALMIEEKIGVQFPIQDLHNQIYEHNRLKYYAQLIGNQSAPNT